jgi:glycerol-3-phosphate acyltransferase PlsY
VGLSWLAVALGDEEEEQLIDGSSMRWLALVLAYVVGSFPTAHLVGTANGVDLRTVGSGNLGATNVFRTLGWKWGLLVYVVDFLKGLLPVLYLPRLAGVEGGASLWAMAFGVLAIAGHVKPLFLLGRGGGKGVATASGVFVALAPFAALCAVGAFVVCVAITRYVSLGSLVGAAVLAAVLVLRDGATPLTYLGATIALFVFFTHRENIGRLMRGEERRIGSKTPAGGAA